MLVSEVMTTKLVTVTPDDTLSHAANLLRQYQFHHLPVVRATHTQGIWVREQQTQKSKPVLEGLLTSQDIDMAAAIGMQSSGDALQRPWQERLVAEIMHFTSITVTP